MLGSLLRLADSQMDRAGSLSLPPSKDKITEARLDALELACAGLWQFLKTKHGYTDEELINVIHELDASDGVMDGRVAPPAADCPVCGRRLLTKQRKRCTWCGADLAQKPF